MSIGAVTMPSTAPARASRTARSIARPLNAPALRRASERLHVPIASCTSTSAARRSHDQEVTRRTDRRICSAARTISGPIPRGSPRVTASRMRRSSAPRGPAALDPDLDVCLLPKLRRAGARSPAHPPAGPESERASRTGCTAPPSSEVRICAMTNLGCPVSRLEDRGTDPRNRPPSCRQRPPRTKVAASRAGRAPSSPFPRWDRGSG